MVPVKQALIYCLIFFQGSLLFAQDAVSVFKKYQTAISNIHTISYSIQRADTFLTGDIWNRRGVCMMQRMKEDSLLGYTFSGTPVDPALTCWYNGQSFYRFDHINKTYELDKKSHKGIIGSPGGQLLCNEFMKADTNFTSIQLTVTPAHYELRLTFPDLVQYDVINRVKILHLDKKTYLPKKVINAQQHFDKRQILTASFNDVQVNDKGFTSKFDHSTLLNSYTVNQPQPKTSKTAPVTLAGKPAPALAGESFEGDSVYLEQYKGRLVLLDFWEVWCGPCVASLPKVQQLHNTYAGKGLTVLGVTLDKRNLTSNKLVAKKNKLAYTNLLGNNTLEKDYQVDAIPKYILVDQSGKIILDQAGFDDNIEKMIKEKLGL